MQYNRLHTSMQIRPVSGEISTLPLPDTTATALGIPAGTSIGACRQARAPRPGGTQVTEFMVDIVAEILFTDRTGGLS